MRSLKFFVPTRLFPKAAIEDVEAVRVDCRGGGGVQGLLRNSYPGIEQHTHLGKAQISLSREGSGNTSRPLEIEIAVGVACR